MRILFAGTPEFAATHLQALLSAQYPIFAVYTQPDRPAGRGHKLTPSPVKVLAQDYGLPVYQPHSLRQTEAQLELESLRPDLILVVAYGLLLPQAVLDVPRLGCINSHASLLPRWRGAAPIQRAIEAGDTHTGISVMQMEADLDTGPVLLSASLPIAPDETGGSLHDKLARLGARTLVKAVDALVAGDLIAHRQDDAEATYAHKLSKEKARLDWSRPALELERCIRAFNPWPACHVKLSGQLSKVLDARVVSGEGRPGQILGADREGVIVACGCDALLLTCLQLPGARALPFADLWNSRRDLFVPGQVLE